MHYACTMHARVRHARTDRPGCRPSAPRIATLLTLWGGSALRRPRSGRERFRVSGGLEVVGGRRTVARQGECLLKGRITDLRSADRCGPCFPSRHADHGRRQERPATCWPNGLGSTCTRRSGTPFIRSCAAWPRSSNRRTRRPSHALGRHFPLSRGPVDRGHCTIGATAPRAALSRRP